MPVPVPVLVRSTTTSTYVSGGRAPIGGGRQHAMQSSGSSTSGNHHAGVTVELAKGDPVRRASFAAEASSTVGHLN